LHEYKELRKLLRFGIVSITAKISGASTTFFFISVRGSVMRDATTV
jgi:hypothetical protein